MYYGGVMMRKTLKKLFTFNYTECDALKEYLEEMALEGWKLKEINVFLVFEKIEPKKLIYSVEVFDKASLFDTQLENSAKEYTDYCAEAGWQFVCNSEKIHVFIATDENAVPIETDEAQKYKTIKKSMFKKNLFNFIWLPIIVFNLFIQYVGDFDYFITSNIRIFTFLTIAIALIIRSIQIIGFLIWCKRAKQNLKMDQKLNYYNKKSLKKRNTLRKIPFCILLVGLVCFAIVSFFRQDFSSGMFALVSLGLLVVSWGVSIWINKMKFSRSVNILIPLILGIAISYVSVFLCLIWVIVFSHESPKVYVDGNTISIVGESEIPLTLEDVSIQVGKYRDTDKSIRESIFAKSRYYYDTTSTKLDDVQKGLHYTIFESNYDFIMDQYINDKLYHSYNRVYEEGNSTVWGANKVYICVNEDNYYALVIYNDFIFDYRSCTALTDDSINTIRERLNLHN